MHSHTQARTQRVWPLSARGLTRYSSAMCGEYCCIPCTQYARHITLLISLTLSLSVSSSYALFPFLHHHLLLALPLSVFLFILALPLSTPPVPSSLTSTLTKCLFAAAQ